jgi:hypothetical protein
VSAHGEIPLAGQLGLHDVYLQSAAAPSGGGLGRLEMGEYVLVGVRLRIRACGLRS